MRKASLPASTRCESGLVVAQPRTDPARVLRGGRADQLLEHGVAAAEDRQLGIGLRHELRQHGEDEVDALLLDSPADVPEQQDVAPLLEPEGLLEPRLVRGLVMEAVGREVAGGIVGSVAGSQSS